MGLALQVCPRGLPSCRVWWLKRGNSFQLAPQLNPSRNNCTIPTCRAPCDFGGLSCTSYPGSVCPATSLLPFAPGLAGLALGVCGSPSIRDLSLPSGSPSDERLCFSLLGLYFIPLWLGAFCRQGTCHLCSDTSRQGLLNYPHPLKIEIHSPAVLRHIFISVYRELSSSYPGLLITAPNLWFAQAFRKIHFFQTGYFCTLRSEVPSCSNAWWWREGTGLTHPALSFLWSALSQGV